MLNHEPRTKRREKIYVQHFCWLNLVYIFGLPYDVFHLQECLGCKLEPPTDGWIWEPHNTSLFWVLGHTPVPLTLQSAPSLSFHTDLVSMLSKLQPIAPVRAAKYFQQNLIGVSSRPRPSLVIGSGCQESKNQAKPNQTPQKPQINKQKQTPHQKTPLQTLTCKNLTCTGFILPLDLKKT